MPGQTGHTSPVPRPGGLYIHIPFCEGKCAYCDFYSVAIADRDAGALIPRLVRELGTRLDGLFRARTVYIGGGTPTILESENLAQLIEAIRDSLRVRRAGTPAGEVTVEANPATLDDRKVEALAQGGVTRISMGAQSFETAELATLGRRHRPDDIAPAVEALRRGGIGQISLDLIFGVPGQTRASWARSLRRAIELDPDHVACYGLTFEPGTPLAALRDAGDVRPCCESLEASLYLEAIDRLTDAGYEHYETSNFAKPGCRCQHNLNYWRNGPYLGVGPSAVGCVADRRYRNVADVDRYIDLIDGCGLAEAESEAISPSMLVTEMILMQLRLIEGMAIAAFRKRTGHDAIELFGETLERLADMGLLTVSDTHIALTRRGRLLSDSVMAELAAATE